MAFKPVNRYIWVEHVEESATEEVKSTILVPADYNVPVSPYGTYKILKVAEDCGKFSSQDEEKTAIVNSSMVEDIKFDGGVYHLISENHIYAIVE